MKKNIKIILACFITMIISVFGSIIAATTILEANKVSYKTSNGDNVDVNSALDRLFNAVDINARLGNADISSIGDGTITGAINELNTKTSSGALTYNPDTDYFGIIYNGEWKDVIYAGLQFNGILYDSGSFTSDYATDVSKQPYLLNGLGNTAKTPNCTNSGSVLSITLAANGTDASNIYSGTVYITPELDFGVLYTRGYRFINAVSIISTAPNELTQQRAFTRMGLVSTEYNNYSMIETFTYQKTDGSYNRRCSIPSTGKGKIALYVASNHSSYVATINISKLYLTKE